MKVSTNVLRALRCTYTCACTGYHLPEFGICNPSRPGRKLHLLQSPGGGETHYGGPIKKIVGRYVIREANPIQSRPMR